MEQLKNEVSVEGIKNDVEECEEKLQNIELEKMEILKRERELRTYLAKVLNLNRYLNKAKTNPLFKLGTNPTFRPKIKNSLHSGITLKTSILEALKDKACIRRSLLKEVRKIRHGAQKNSFNTALWHLTKDRIIKLDDKKYSLV